MKHPAFRSEEELFEAIYSTRLLERLHHADGWSVWDETEVEGLFGRPDYVVGHYRIEKDGSNDVRLVAFELKLSNWKRALIQAFRYSSFAHYVYVILDHHRVRPALGALDRFQRANIGLLSFSKSKGLIYHHHPSYRIPYASSLELKLKRRIIEHTI